MRMVDLPQMTDKEIQQVIIDLHSELRRREEQKRQNLFDKLRQVLDEIEAEGFRVYDAQGEIIDSQNVEVEELWIK